MLNPSEYDLVRMGFDCKAPKELLPNEDGSCKSTKERLQTRDVKPVCTYLYVSDCAKACHAKTGCTYFTFGFDRWLWVDRAICFWMKTESSNCTEGWEKNEYNFFEIIGMLDKVIVIVRALFLISLNKCNYILFLCV